MINMSKLDALLAQAGSCVNQGNLTGAILVLMRAVKEAHTGNGVPSVPEGEGKAVTNLYVENGKLKIEYEE